MFELSKRLTAAMEAVLYIAYNSGTRPISSRQLAEYQAVKTRYLEQVLQKLVHGGLLRGVRGPYGGYLLAKDKRHITLGDICGIICSGEGEEKGHPSFSASPMAARILAPLWENMEQEVKQRLDTINLGELCALTRQNGIRRESDEKADFAI